MKIEVDESGTIVLKEVFNSVCLESGSGHRMAVCMRDEGFEIRVLPKDGQPLPWAIVNLETGQADSLPNPRPLTNNTTIAWAVDRWEKEVKNRSLNNVHRRTLDDTWRQVIKHHGGNPNELLGPAHDMMVWAERYPDGQEPAPVESEFTNFWIDPSTVSPTAE